MFFSKSILSENKQSNTGYRQTTQGEFNADLLRNEEVVPRIAKKTLLLKIIDTHILTKKTRCYINGEQDRGGGNKRWPYMGSGWMKHKLMTQAVPLEGVGIN